MNNSPKQSFRHRENQDGSWDSICMRCYLTAAHSYGEQPLALVESGHHCDETNWLFSAPARDLPMSMVFRTAHTVRFASPDRTCPASAIPRFSHQPEAAQHSRHVPAGRHAGRPAGLRQHIPSERSSSY